MSNDSVYKFWHETAELHYDSGNRRLIKGPARIKLEKIPRELLEYLLGNPRRVVTYEELKTDVWRAASVENASIYAAVRKVRKALGEALGNEQLGADFIENHKGEGIEFRGSVEVLAGGAPPESARWGSAARAEPPAMTPGLPPQAPGSGAPMSPLSNDEMIRVLRKWHTRPAACKDVEIVGRFDVGAGLASAAEPAFVEAVGIPKGDVVEVGLHTPGFAPHGNFEYITACATGSEADLLESLAESADPRNPAQVIAKLRGYGAYISKRDNGEAKPAVFVVSATPVSETPIDDGGSENAGPATPPPRRTQPLSTLLDDGHPPLPDEIESTIQSAEAYESIGDVWSAASRYEELAGKLEVISDPRAAEIKRRAKKSRSAAAAIMRGDW